MVVLDLRKLEAFTDYFVICTGDVDQQVRAIAEHIAEQAELQTNQRALHREGLETLNWVLLDYVDVVVHVFKPSFRAFYRLEDLWSDATEMVVSDGGTVSAEKVSKPKVRRVKLAGDSERAKPARTAKKAGGPKSASARGHAAKKPARKRGA